MRTARVVPSLAGGVLSVMMLAACATPEPVSRPLVAVPDGASDEHREAMEDGKVTEDEYTAGWRRFVACIEDEGYDVVELGRPSTLYDAAIPAAASDSGVMDSCYDLEFLAIDAVWQIENPPTTDATPKLIACLEDAGLPTDGNEEELKQRMVDNGLDVVDCLGL